ncbi:hypothetical protein [Pseudomonas sp. Marseille-Q5115]|uniref:hypothetical protein n=1 Tax=Pseudomonas sp. Marseille-Q5115 TaxID=2866593 RepID=UPI001CE46EB1|nr:hypothetical protein [Pseudomonas sp. Marseille-Q5115]
MTDNYTAQIEQLIAILNRKIAEGDALLSRDAAYAAYQELGSLREQSGISAEAQKLLEQASQKVWRLYEAFHLEVQHDLEWANSRGDEDV